MAGGQPFRPKTHRNGSPRDSIGIRGRWKHQKRQVDVYVDTTVPYPQHHYCSKAAAVFGRAVLWACFDPLASKLVPQDILSRVQREYERVCILDHATNPVQKVGLVVCGYEGQLFIDDLIVN